MGRRVKEGKRGQVAKYVSRSKAIRKLQLSLKDFRRMCILKGVYPREPPKKLKKHNRTFYHLKDINFLSLDPLIDRLRAQKVYFKKYRSAKAKGNIGKIKYLSKHKPTLQLNHLVRQRYPDFTDALRDLDDPLTLISLFSIFPSHKQFNLSASTIDTCSVLMKHLQLYAIYTHSLKKAFVSIKGIYYQLQIMGIKVTYITPYKYPPTLPIDVDYKVMSTFLNFYIVLLKFVLFKLYNIQNLQYPPQQSIQGDEPSFKSFEMKFLSKVQEQKYKIDEEFNHAQINSQNLLFSNLTFYLSSQVPKYSLEFIILSAGGLIADQITDKTITHVITDRDNLKIQKLRQYVQPQWIYDSLNFNKLLSVKEYWVGEKLPPHVSPFLDQKDLQRYIPDREKQLRNLEMPIQSKQSVTVVNKKIANKYDILHQKKQEVKQKQKQSKDLAQVSKGLISNKDRKLLRVIQTSKTRKQEVKNKLKDKAKGLK